jgi:hypothetical protein
MRRTETNPDVTEFRLVCIYDAYPVPWTHRAHGHSRCQRHPLPWLFLRKLREGIGEPSSQLKCSIALPCGAHGRRVQPLRGSWPTLVVTAVRSLSQRPAGPAPPCLGSQHAYPIHQEEAGEQHERSDKRLAVKCRIEEEEPPGLGLLRAGEH